MFTSATAVTTTSTSNSIGSDGELTPLTPATVSTDGCGLPWLTASGSSFYVPDGGFLEGGQSIYQFDVSSTGA